MDTNRFSCGRLGVSVRVARTSYCSVPALDRPVQATAHVGSRTRDPTNTTMVRRWVLWQSCRSGLSCQSPHAAGWIMCQGEAI